MNQKSLFPAIDVEKKHTLFIIGNGFDIAHEIKSQYSDFAEWVQQQGNDRLVQMMDIPDFVIAPPKNHHRIVFRWVYAFSSALS